MVSALAGAAPIVVGLKVSTTVQLAPGDTLGLMHVDDPPIEYGVPGVTASASIVRVFGWLFVTVTVFAALVVPVCTLPKASVLGETATGAIPVPDSVAVFGVFEASVLIVSEPDGRAPTESGFTVTKIVQLELAASVPGF
jgi:hypothetical protein